MPCSKCGKDPCECLKKAKEEHKKVPPEDVSSEKKCPLAELCVIVKTSEGDPVGHATVTLTNKKTNDKKSPKTTDHKKGKYDFGKVEPDVDYTVTAKKPWHLNPKSKLNDEKSVKLAQKEKKTVNLTLDPIEVHMYLDNDRDGKISDDWDDWKNNNKWEWGMGKYGAIILCNNDDDYDGATRKKKGDNEDEEINGGNDEKEIAPLDLRFKGPEPLDTWKAKLEILAGNENRIRIFEGRNKGDKQILGKGKGKEFKLPKWKKWKTVKQWKDLKYGMEATQYADKDFDGQIKLKLTVTAPSSGWKDHEEESWVRVAPWMMMHHLMEAKKVYVVKTSDNATFRSDLKTALGGIPLDESIPSTDRWMQDRMELGQSCLTNHVIHAIIRSPQTRPLAGKIKKFLDKDVGYAEPGNSSSPTTYDSFGNLEVTPPVKNKSGKSYPFGRIYYGPGSASDRIDSDLEEFLKKQIVQPPIELDTSWLTVGHVDEMLTFVPDGKGGSKLLIVSPELAYDILRDLRTNGKGACKLLKGRHIELSTWTGTTWASSLISVETTVTDFLTNGLPMISQTAGQLDNFNKNIQSKLNWITKVLELEIGIEAKKDIIPVPVIFIPNHAAPTLADSLTADMVNLLVANKLCIFPIPFGPIDSGTDIFQKKLETELTKLGLTPKPIDDWKTYHMVLGEVHCGTNTMRKVEILKWWEFEP
jgi:protein-arginine deiminase